MTEYKTGHRARDAVKLLGSFQSGTIHRVTVQQFVKVRNYLLVLITLDNACRARGNLDLTVDDYNNRIENQDESVIITVNLYVYLSSFAIFS